MDTYNFFLLKDFFFLFFKKFEDHVDFWDYIPLKIDTYFAGIFYEHDIYFTKINFFKKFNSFLKKFYKFCFKIKHNLINEKLKNLNVNLYKKFFILNNLKILKFLEVNKIINFLEIDKNDFFFKKKFNNINYLNIYFYRNFYRLIFSLESILLTYSHFYKNKYSNSEFSAVIDINVKNDSLMITNHSSLNSVNKFLYQTICEKVIKNDVPEFYKHIYYAISNSVEFITKKRFFFKIYKNKLIDLKNITIFFNIYLKNKHYQFKVGRGFFLHEMIEILFYSFRHKDLNYLIDWFVKTMYRISFNSHRKLLSALKNVVCANTDFFMNNNNVKGFFFDIRGKVGVTGNAKKRNFFFSVGKFSKTTKNSNFDYQHDIVRTNTGALGITMIMYY